MYIYYPRIRPFLMPQDMLARDPPLFDVCGTPEEPVIYARNVDGCCYYYYHYYYVYIYICIYICICLLLLLLLSLL